MNARRVAVNDRGAVVGQDHWRAKLTDHDVELIRQLLAERGRLVRTLQEAGTTSGRIDRRLQAVGLSYAAIALKFEVSKSYVRDIANERVRAQTSFRAVIRSTTNG